MVGITTFCSAQISPEVQPTAKQLAGSVYIGPSMNTLRELTDNFGGRLSGSPAHNRAVDWAVARFRSYGIQNVHTGLCAGDDSSEANSTGKSGGDVAGCKEG